MSLILALISLLTAICLQIYLSMKPNKYLGFILPIISTVQLFVNVYFEIRNYDVYVYYGGSAPLNALLLYLFIGYLIAISFNLIIYWLCRRKLKRDSMES